MSRRESRSSLGARQSNALEEFENFKKKYLLVNKHIAKLNSSLNVRIEELLSQIAILNSDNLRLRASELSLARRLANEQDMKRRLYKETESASKLLMDQVNSMKIMFGLDRPANPVTLRAVVAPRTTASRPSQPTVNRLARPPEFDMINEASEDGLTPSKEAARRGAAASPTPSSNTPVRRRSTGSPATPRSTPASNASPSPDGFKVGRTAVEPRKSTPPISMEISNNSSPLSPSPSVSITNQPVPISPSPVISVGKGTSVMSPPTVDNAENTEKDAAERDKSPQPSSVPHLNLFGMKRVSRRPSGLLTGEPSLSRDSDKSTTKNAQPSVSVSIPTTDIPKPSSASAAYPTPLSPNPAPCTPPRQPMVLSMQESEIPLTPTRKLPMSPSLSANPALSPPPAKKLSLTRRQLDFGITDSEDAEKDSDDDAGRDSDDGLMGFHTDNAVGRNARKRKVLEDEEEDAPAFTMDTKVASRGKRVEKRRDTGAVLPGFALKENSSKVSLVAEAMESKESLRDVTNERASPSLVAPPPQDAKPVKPAITGTERPVVSEPKVEPRPLASVGVAARIQRMESRAQAPLVSPIPLPTERVKVALDDDQDTQSGDAAETAGNMDLGRRGSGRVRKSVNYKEPSLISKMRKPDSNSQPSSTSASSSARSSGETLSAASHRPPKRKKGSISLVHEVIGSSSSTPSTATSSTGGSEVSSARSEGDRVRNLTEGLLRTKRSARDADLDLSSSDEEYDIINDNKSRFAGDSGIPNTSSATTTKPSVGGPGRGLSILSKGRNPIITAGLSSFSLLPPLTTSLQPGSRMRELPETPPRRIRMGDDTRETRDDAADAVAT